MVIQRDTEIEITGNQLTLLKKVMGGFFFHKTDNSGKILIKIVANKYAKSFVELLK